MAMVIVMRELKICRQINLQQKLLGTEYVVFVFSYVLMLTYTPPVEFVRLNIRKSVYARHDF